MPPATATGPQFDFGKPFTYVFDDPRWLQKILIGGLFYLAGCLLVGWFFVLGYVARTARNVIAGAALPLPEWDDLGEFFNEGLRLVGVMLVYIVPFVVIMFSIMIPAGILGAVDNEGVQALGSGMAGCFACLMVPLSLAVMVFAPCSLLFAIVEQRFGAAFEFGRMWPFIKANVGNYLLAVVVYLIARFLGGFGIALLCIGVIFTGFWSFLITTHAFAQVYRLSLTPKP
jgi:cbb3-type cytochrome oxidase subunit 3